MAAPCGIFGAAGGRGQIMRYGYRSCAICGIPTKVLYWYKSAEESAGICLKCRLLYGRRLQEAGYKALTARG